MKKYIVEIIIFCIQLFMFYISPLFAGPTEYGNGCFNSIGYIDTVHFTWQYFQKQNKIFLSGCNGSGLFAVCVSLLQWNSIYACHLVFCCIGIWHVGWNDHI